MDMEQDLTSRHYMDGYSDGKAWAQSERGDPVAWIRPDELQKARRAPYLCRVEPAQRYDFVPLYAAPKAAPQPVAQAEPCRFPSCQFIGCPAGGCYDDAPSPAPAPAAPVAQGDPEGWSPAPANTMTAHQAAYFMRRFKREEKLLGPNEQAAVDFVIAMLEAHPLPAPASQPVSEPAAPRAPLTDGQIGKLIQKTFGTLELPAGYSPDDMMAAYKLGANGTGQEGGAA